MRDHFHNILQNLNIGVIVIDLKGKIILFDDAAEKITGLASEEIIGKDFDKNFLFTFIQDDSINFKFLMKNLKNSEANTKIYGKENADRNIVLSASPVTSSQGRSSGIAITLQETTKIKKVQEQEIRSIRLSAMEDIAADIAHEIRNPLGSIELFASLLRKELKEFEEVKTFAEHISSGVQNLNNVLSDILLFTKPQQKPKFQTVDIQTHLHDIIYFTNHLIKPSDKIKIMTKYDANKLRASIDLEMMKQVYLHLILNAIQAMPDGGTLSVSARQFHAKPSCKAMVEMDFSDTGIGINKEDMSNVFDPFFTTKQKKAGIGLTIVHNTLKVHNGTIDIESSEGVGTTCRVTLPLCNGAKV